VLLKQEILTILAGFAIEIFLQLTASDRFAGVSLYLLLDEDDPLVCCRRQQRGRFFSVWGRLTAVKIRVAGSRKILQFLGKREAPFVFNR
jgi:hypothetical protein